VYLEDIIKMDLRKLGYEGDWNELAPVRCREH